MKITKFTCLTLATAILASSCCSSYQAASGATGAIIGGHVGETIGFLSGRGHFRGENAALGSLIGMGVGAILGVGIANQNEQREREMARQRQVYQNQNVPSQDGSTEGGPDYQIGGGAYQGSLPSAVSISTLTYMDADGDGYLSKGETIEVEGYITNTSDMELKDIVICLNANNQRNIQLSPSLTTTLQPGQKIRYTGRVHCEKSLRGRPLSINLSTDHNGKKNTSTTLFIETI